MSGKDIDSIIDDFEIIMESEDNRRDGSGRDDGGNRAGEQPSDLLVVEEPLVAPAAAQQPSEPAGAGEEGKVPIIIIRIRLPSEHLGSKSRIEKVDGRLREVRVLSRLANRLKVIRTVAAEQLARFAVNLGGFWITIPRSELIAGVRVVAEHVRRRLLEVAGEAERLGEVEVAAAARRAAGRPLRLYKVLMEPEDAEELIGEAVRFLEDRIKEIKSRINEAKSARRCKYARKLTLELKYVEKLYSAFKEMLREELARIRGRGA